MNPPQSWSWFDTLQAKVFRCWCSTELQRWSGLAPTGLSTHVSQFHLVLRACSQKQHLATVQTFISSSTRTWLPGLLTNTSNSACPSRNSLSSVWCFYSIHDPSYHLSNSRDSSFIPGARWIAKSYWFGFHTWLSATHSSLPPHIPTLLTPSSFPL